MPARKLISQSPSSQRSNRGHTWAAPQEPYTLVFRNTCIASCLGGLDVRGRSRRVWQSRFCRLVYSRVWYRDRRYCAREETYKISVLSIFVYKFYLNRFNNARNVELCSWFVKPFVCFQTYPQFTTETRLHEHVNELAVCQCKEEFDCDKNGLMKV